MHAPQMKLNTSKAARFAVLESMYGQRAKSLPATAQPQISNQHWRS